MVGDQGLPAPARLQVLLRLADDAIGRREQQKALNLFAEMHGIGDVQRPLDSYIVEAKVAGSEKDYVRARCVLQAYFAKASDKDASYREAVDLYAALEDLGGRVSAQ